MKIPSKRGEGGGLIFMFVRIYVNFYLGFILIHS